MSTAPTVLLLTHAADYYTVDLVGDALARRGARPLRIDTDRFPAALALTARPGSSGVALTLRAGGEALDLREVRAVWSRRLWPGRQPKALDPRFRAFCSRTSRAFFLDALLALEGPRWVNPAGPGLRAESKLLQLEAAHAVGLRVPRTIVTNDPAEVRRFYEETGGALVTKLLHPLTQTMDGSGAFVYTQEVPEAALDHLDDELRFAPQIFQERVPKRRELRVSVVGARCFVGALSPPEAPDAPLDWRIAPSAAEASPWSPADLDEDTQAGIARLMRRLGLVYGALDLIVTDDGPPVFLEVNPAGEWGFLERDLGLPIADAIAEALLEPQPAEQGADP